MGAVVGDVVAGVGQVLHQVSLELEPGVVSGNVQVHGPHLPSRPYAFSTAARTMDDGGRYVRDGGPGDPRQAVHRRGGAASDTPRTLAP
ncbi:hypothetical protein GCM10027059_43570 [Myceligenerans halotolerans]